MSERLHSLDCVSRCLSRLVVTASQRFDGHLPLIVGIAGDGALGKSTLADALASATEGSLIVSTDGFLLSRLQRRLSGGISGDDPAAIDLHSLEETLISLSRGRGATTLREYDHKTGDVKVKLLSASIVHPRIILVEGSYALYQELASLLHLRIFLSANYSVRHALRLAVDTQERGYSVAEFEANWPRYVELYDQHISPTSRDADVEVEVTADRRFILNPDRSCHCMCNWIFGRRWVNQ